MAKPRNPIFVPALAALLTPALLALPLRAQAPQAPPMPPIPVPMSASQPPAPPVPPMPEIAAPAESPSAVIPAGLAPENRDPFWPVGYRPKTPEELALEKAQAELIRKKITPPKWDDARAALRIGGYMKTPGGYTSLINNTMVTAGDVIALLYEGKHYRWKVESISARGISLAQLDCLQLDTETQNPGKGQP